MNRSRAFIERTIARVPHTRGDEPFPGCRLFRGSSVFPTPVGMNRSSVRLQLTAARVPHTRGDEPDHM